MKNIKQKKSLCVFCGSKNGNSSIYKEAAEKLGEQLAKNQIKLVYGGGSLGLMGELSKSVHKNNGEVLGIIPKHLLNIEGIDKKHGEIIITDDIWETKANNIGLKKVQTKFATIVQDDMLILQDNCDKKLLENN